MRLEAAMTIFSKYDFISKYEATKDNEKKL